MTVNMAGQHWTDFCVSLYCDHQNIQTLRLILELTNSHTLFFLTLEVFSRLTPSSTRSRSTTHCAPSLP